MSKDNFVKSYYKQTNNLLTNDKFLLNEDEIPEYRISILKCFQKEILRYVLADMDTILSQCESPIEELLAGALIIIGYENIGVIHILPKYEQFKFGNGLDTLVIWPQFQIGDYRVDFYIELWDGYERSWRGKGFAAKLIVECDGHDYHEKTKEQAQKDKERDRILQSCGYQIFRFTGAEIWKDSFKCASSVLDYLINKNKEMAKSK